MFPEPTDILQISVNAKRPAPPYGGLGSVFEASAFFRPHCWDPMRDAGNGTNRVDTGQGYYPRYRGPKGLSRSAAKFCGS
jgi:hypothetical protein